MRLGIDQSTDKLLYTDSSDIVVVLGRNDRFITNLVLEDECLFVDTRGLSKDILLYSSPR